ncbi:lipoyltransferase [Novosphingobium sp.]|uniref:lipoyltransferase n=1 Tax=Novosphingobium sp. TaxID=1874826 RepID=UPI00286C87F5|nr:lipoyltransferase [Novosphingobium sp.]
MNTSPLRRPFDSNRAWQRAVALIKANRDLLLALAGVFVVLPAFAVAILLPPPALAEGADLQAALATMGEYYRENAPALVASGLFHLAGTLAMLALFTDASRPTVGQAISTGFKRMPTVIFAQIILGAAVGSMLLVPMILGDAMKSPGLTVLGVSAGLGLGIWALVRLSLIAPVVMVEALANPAQALRRSWHVTEGNALRLLFFFGLVFIAFLVSTTVIEGLVHALVLLVAGSQAAMLVSTLVATSVQAAMTVCFTAIGAASYWQLTGEPGGETAQTFS